MSLQKRDSMRRYLLQYLMCASVALSLTSCMPRLLVSESQASVSAESVDDDYAGTVEDNAELALTETSGDTTDGRYDFVLKAGRRELSGVMVARPVSPGTVRVIGATYFGLTLFDITLSKDSYTMNSSADFLSGKPFASFLAMKLRKTISL